MMFCHIISRKSFYNAAFMLCIFVVTKTPIKWAPNLTVFLSYLGYSKKISESWELSIVKQKILAISGHINRKIYLKTTTLEKFFFIEDKSTRQFYFEITLKKKFCAGLINGNASIKNECKFIESNRKILKEALIL